MKNQRGVTGYSSVSFKPSRQSESQGSAAHAGENQISQTDSPIEQQHGTKDDVSALGNVHFNCGPS